MHMHIRQTGKNNTPCKWQYHRATIVQLRPDCFDFSVFDQQVCTPQPLRRVNLRVSDQILVHLRAPFVALVLVFTIA